MEIGAINLQAAAFISQVIPPLEKRTEQKELIKAVKAINNSEMFGQNSELTFVLDRQTHRPLLRIVDRETREVIQQIPPEYVLRMAEELARER